jgi:hypothetical protein
MKANAQEKVVHGDFDSPQSRAWRNHATWRVIEELEAVRDEINNRIAAEVATLPARQRVHFRTKTNNLPTPLPKPR